MCLVFPHFFIIRLGGGFFNGRAVVLIWESGGRVILLFPKFEIFSAPKKNNYMVQKEGER